MERKWIKTCDRLPTKEDCPHGFSDHVSCYIYVDGAVIERPWNLHHECWDDADYDDFQYEATKPTHWMVATPLPSAPKDT